MPETAPPKESTRRLSVDPPGSAQERGHGRHATSPEQVPLKGWRDVAARLRHEAKEDNVALLAAGVAFYSLLALVPGLVAVVSIYALVADPGEIGSQVVRALSAAPREVRQLVTAQLEAIAEGAGGSTLFAAISGIVIALWTASAGVGHLVAALNVAYDEQETRGWVRRKVMAIVFTVGAILFVVVAFGVITVLPEMLDEAGLGIVGRWLVETVRWIALFGGMVVGLAILYRYGPDRDAPQWRWASPGAVLAAALWVVGSIVFSIYTSNFGSYNETYGSLGAIVVAMLWLFLTALVVILGAELNSELERQTLVDTTTGDPEPIGDRDAYAADTVGKTAAAVKNTR